MTTGGGGGNSPQDPNSLGGKVLRLKDDGTVPSDNPFVGLRGASARDLHDGPSQLSRAGDASWNG